MKLKELNLTSSINKPDFLSRAKLVSENKPAEFMSRAKLVSAPEEQYMSDEEFERNIERNQAQQFSRAGEAILGLPGDLVNFVGGLLGYEPDAPGSEKLREISESVSQGYTKPQNELEEKAGELMQDVALFALPGGKHYSVARNLGIPILGNLVKEGIKYSGADEQNQAMGKMGSMVLMDILGHRNALGSSKEFATNLFKKADEAIPKGLSINSTNLEKSLNNLEKVLTAGGERPSTGDAIKKISEIKSEIKNGKIDLKSLVAYRPAINEYIDKYKGFDFATTPAMRKKIIHNLNQVKGEVIKAAEEYGEHYNPEYLNLSKSANEAYAAYAQSNKITNFIEKHVSSKLKSTGAKALLGVSLAGGHGALASTLGIPGAIGGAGVGLGYSVFKRILRAKSPTLRNHYFKILEGAAKGNTAEVIKNSKFLDKELTDLDETGEIDGLD